MADDRISLEGMVFYGYHGAREEEQRLGQRFVVDVTVELDLSRAGRSDDLADTLDYGELYRAVKAVVEGPSRRLLERLAEEIAAAVLRWGDVEEVWVKVAKPGVPIKGSILSQATVQIHRRQAASGPVA